MNKWLKLSGIIAGVAVFAGLTMGAVAFAQEPVDQQSDTTIQSRLFARIGDGLFGERFPGKRGHGAFGPGDAMDFRGQEQEALAEALGMTVDELQAAIQDGQTPQEIAEAQGLNWDDVQTQLREQALATAKEQLQQAVEDGKLTQEQADNILERMENAPLGEGPFPGKRGHGAFGPGDAMDFRGQGQEALAEALGMTVDELQAAIQDGQTPQEIAEAQGLNWDEVQTQLREQALATAKEQLQQAVEDGKLTQEQADNILERMENAPLGEGPLGHPMPGRGGRGMQHPNGGFRGSR